MKGRAVSLLAKARPIAMVARPQRLFIARTIASVIKNAAYVSKRARAPTVAVIVSMGKTIAPTAPPIRRLTSLGFPSVIPRKTMRGSRDVRMTEGMRQATAYGLCCAIRASAMMYLARGGCSRFQYI